MDLLNLAELVPGKSYDYKSEISEVEGSLRVVGEGANPIVLLNVDRACNEKGYIRLGVHTVVIIGWILDTDDFVPSQCLQPFSGEERLNFGESNLLGLRLNGKSLSPRPVLLGKNPQIEEAKEPDTATQRRDW